MTWVQISKLPRILKIKYNVDSFVANHKVCLVARGFTQVQGIDFNETFPMLHEWNQFELYLYVITTIKDFKVHQKNVKTTFLNGDISKEIYIQ